MKKGIIRFLAALLAMLMLICFVACDEEEPDPSNGDLAQTPGNTDDTQTPGNTDGAQTPETAENTIDIYLIAGQSNAAGHSKITSNADAYAWCAELKNGFSNIYYAGNSRSDNGSSVVNRDLDWRRAKLGFGIDASKLGPEAGMAKALSAYYNEESGKSAGIIKMAHGGTGLLNTETGSNKFGNWCPPSYASYINASWNNPITGQLYRDFLAEVKQNLEDLENCGPQGFTKFNIKGLYWMQGCNNRYNPDEYAKAFEFFARDIRKDLADMITEMTGSDCGAANMPIFVGTISETFSTNGSYDTITNVNMPFIAMQKKLPERVSNCYIVDNSQFVINKWDAGTQTFTVVGSDSAHWNQADALTIGDNVGKMMLEKCTQ